jgi:hypothetical protein
LEATQLQPGNCCNVGSYGDPCNQEEADMACFSPASDAVAALIFSVGVVLPKSLHRLITALCRDTIETMCCQPPAVYQQLRQT